jgi:hypothetical protein
MATKQLVIEAKVSSSLKIRAIDLNSQEGKTLNVPSSIGLGVPTKFYVPSELSFARMEYTRLLNKQGKPTVGLGLAVVNEAGETVIISVNSLFRSYYETEPQIDPKDNTRFITKGIERINAFDVLKGINTMNFAPSELVTKFFAGKTFEKVGEETVYIPKYNTEHELVGFEDATKPLFAVVSETAKDKSEKPAKSPKK